MADALADIEPYYGWLGYYDPELDTRNPFGLRDAEAPDDAARYLYTFEANPRWESIGSESLLAKVLYANYDEHFAVIELMGEWNDLFENDWRLLTENCLDWMLEQGITQFILLCENVFHIYLDSDDYYEAFAERNADVWVCLLRAREEVLAELERYRLSGYFYWNSQFDDLRWRKMKPWELFAQVKSSMDRLLGAGTGV